MYPILRIPAVETIIAECLIEGSDKVFLVKDTEANSFAVYTLNPNKDSSTSHPVGYNQASAFVAFSSYVQIAIAKVCK